MAYDSFICPDGQVCKIDDCIQKCRIPEKFEAGRCLSKRTLLAITKQREWKGVPSVTQLLSGTRETYLRITKTYPIDPQQMIFALFGTGVHNLLEKFTPDNSISEERLLDPTGTYSGAYDCYDEEEGVLYDVKTYGSYKTMKVMGLVKIKEPILDESGNIKKYRNGKPMYNTTFVQGRKDRFDVAVQLNAYRICLEGVGKKVNTMLVEIITRDAGTYSARDRGIFTNAQLIKINKISDRWIQRYMLKKAELLHEALNTGKMPAPCKHRETWGGLKCKHYCPVWMYCDVGLSARNKEDLEVAL